MPDHTNNINLDKIVSDDQKVGRGSWSCLGQTCSRSVVVFLSQFYEILLIICVCFWRIHLAKTCDESTIWVGTLCSAAGYILPSPKIRTSNFSKKPHFYISGWTHRFWQNVLDTWVVESWNSSTQNWQNLFIFFSNNTLNHSMMSCKKKLIN